MRKIKVCDTTLRDCEHFGDFYMSVREKVEIAKQLERLGVDIIEVGVLSDAILEVAKEIKGSVFSVACRINEFYDVDVQAALGIAAHSRVNLLCHEVRDTDYLEQLKGVIQSAKDKGFSIQITFDALSMENEEFMHEVLDIVSQLGINSICVYENMGYMISDEISNIITDMKDNLSDIDISIKCKNDLGFATANTLAAVKAGASLIESSIGGLGVRAGNAALEQIIMALSARHDYYDVSTNIVKRLIHRTCNLVSTIVGQPVKSNTPIVGSKALDREDIILNNAKKIAFIRPEEIGVIRNNLVLGPNTSFTVFCERVDELGYILSKEKQDSAYETFIDLANRKGVVTDKDIEAIVSPMEDSEKRFELVSFVINSGTMIPSTATLIVSDNNEVVTEVAVGLGPVDASFKAIDIVTGITVNLEDFALQSVTEGEDALGDAMVRVSCDGKTYTGRGISTDIIESSIRAYINALNKVAAAL